MILLTGGAGYIGSHAAIEFIKAGYPIIVLDNFSNSKMEAVKRTRQLAGEEFPFIEGDIRDRALLDNIFQQYPITAVVHFAGFKAGGNQIVRVTADCMGIDSTTIHETLAHLRNNDYSYSCAEFGYPPGHGCEAFTFRALREAHKKVDSLYDIEHVTPYIQRSFTWVKWKIARYDGFELELNTLEDYQRIKNIYGYKTV